VRYALRRTPYGMSGGRRWIARSSRARGLVETQSRLPALQEIPRADATRTWPLFFACRLPTRLLQALHALREKVVGLTVRRELIPDICLFAVADLDSGPSTTPGAPAVKEDSREASSVGVRRRGRLI
jgi:hypothetical protein